MTSLKQPKKLYNAGGIEAEKERRSDVTILMRINTLIEYHWMYAMQLKETKVTSVKKVFDEKCAALKFDAEHLALLNRLLAQSMFGVNADFVRDEKRQPIRRLPFQLQCVV